MKLLLHHKGVRADQVLLGALSKLALHPDKKHDDEVHNTRVGLKRLKALLRLLEDMGIRGAKTHRRALQIQGRKLGPFREAQVIEKYRPKLEAKGKKITDDEKPDGTPHAVVTQATRVSKQTIKLEDRVRDTHFDVHEVADALERTLKRCRKAYRICEKDSDMENFHELRKRTKELQYQLELVEPIMERFPRDLKTHLKDLTSLLGEAHDWVDISHHIKGPKKAVRKADKLNRKALKMAKPILKKSHAMEVSSTLH
jgi:CHAD domain-containing protein